ncbi:MAG: aminoacyl-histidine dipeptidase [Huintestinicola sp.]
MNISELEPKKVFDFFSQIAAIPHGSGNTEALRKMCAGFAESKGLLYYCDDAGNIIIRKDGTADYENSEPVIIQGHLDMVCEKREDCPADMEKDGLILKSDGEYIYAEGTTLGGDDGIAIAYSLALLDSEDIPHPPLEILLTSDEETGLAGAEGLDFSDLKGRRLINIDSEEEGILTTGCAGGIRADCTLPVEWTEPKGKVLLDISVIGLRGGHSGVDINKHRANAVRVLAMLAEKLSEEYGAVLCSINGGTKDNVIPKYAHMVIAADADKIKQISDHADSFSAELSSELYGEEAVFTVSEHEGTCSCMTDESMKKVLFLLIHSPNGVMEMMPDIPDMVLSSLNMGAAEITDGKLSVKYLLRGNTNAGRKALERKLSSFMRFMGADISFSAAYPPWEYRESSPLRDTMAKVFREEYGKEPVIAAIHAGLECAVFDSKTEGLDMVSFGPDIENVHTPDERMNIASVNRCWTYLLKVLKNLK